MKAATCLMNTSPENFCRGGKTLSLVPSRMSAAVSCLRIHVQMSQRFRQRHLCLTRFVVKGLSGPREGKWGQMKVLLLQLTWCLTQFLCGGGRLSSGLTDEWTVHAHRNLRGFVFALWWFRSGSNAAVEEKLDQPFVAVSSFTSVGTRCSALAER